LMQRARYLVLLHLCSEKDGNRIANNCL